jgi:hypothetical protein
MDFETVLNGWGRGTINLATKDVKIRDIWPHAVSIYITRIAGPSASPENPVVEFAGYVESISASDSGQTSIGLQSIEEYLNHRMLTNEFARSGAPQTAIARDLVNLAHNNDGIPLSGAATSSTRLRDRTYEPWDRKIIGEAVVELTEVIDGPDWELEHTRTEGAWSTKMLFRDHVGAARDLTLQSDREANGYGLDVDAANHATYVDGLGSGEEEDMLVSHAEDGENLYPRFDAAPAWKDVKRLTTLQEHTDGYLADFQDPLAMPSVTIPGFEVDSTRLRLGDTFTVHTDFGAVTYKGQVRILGIGWNVGEGADTRTFTLYPVGNVRDTLLGQVSTEDGCEDC